MALGLCSAQLGTALNFRHEVREALFGDGVHDDLLLPRYAESAFRPDAIAKRVLEISKENPDLGGVFVSFDADHYSVIMHGKFLDVPEGLWLFDSPKRGRNEASRREESASCAERATGAPQNVSPQGAGASFRFRVQRLVKMSEQ
jgi:hypothetical protein